MNRTQQLPYWQRRNNRTSRVANVLFIAALVFAVAVVAFLAVIKLEQAISVTPTIISILIG